MENSHLEKLILKFSIFFFWNFLEGLASNAQVSSNIGKTPTPRPQRQKLVTEKSFNIDKPQV